MNTEFLGITVIYLE